ncbi:MAG TPA: Na+/H+ antiporter NhaC family protein [Pseudogracilibacillus sp.]|nr:Na+/H+ antiporter NhaC family protein [Pseudogracilibacillus sp.]
MLNAVVISIIVMVVLSLSRVNVIFALILAALTAGLMSGLDLSDSAELMIKGMGGQSETALSYILLGIFAVMISMSGITNVLVQGLLSVFTGKRVLLVFTLAGIASLSQNVIPVHIAFIPILIPPLLVLFDRLKLDRRAVAAALAFGLKFPYITIPVGFGLIYQGIIYKEIVKNGIEITKVEIMQAMLFPGAAMIIGLLVAVLITYRKDRVSKSVSGEHLEAMAKQGEEAGPATFHWKHGIAVLAILAALFTQLYFDSLVIGAMSGIIVMFIGRVVRLNEGEKIVHEGIGMMGMIAFVMLIASGYANVLKETGAIKELVENTVAVTGDSPLLIALVLLGVGLLITIGIGTSFGTIPILAALYAPVLIETGMSPLASAALIGTAAALGDAGSPASDSTLGATAGLNADGRHHHIWETCVPTFLHYNIPLFIIGIIAAIVL